MDNGTQESHDITVVIEDESGTVLLDHTFQMEPRTGDAEVAFTGTASMVTVHIDEDVTKEFPWSPEESEFIDSGECSGGNTVALEILLIGPNFDDPDDEPDDEGDFIRTFRCSVPDPSL